MIDTQQLIRKAFFEALNGELTYDSVSVPVFDEMANGEQTLYVILSTQTTTDYPTLTCHDTNETMLVDICQKTDYSITKDGIDSVANQILQIIIPNGLPAQAGIKFSNIRIESINTVNFAEVGIIRKLIRFSFKVNQ